MANYNVYGVRALRIAIGTILVFLILMGGTGTVSYAVSDNSLDNYLNIASSTGNFPDRLPDRPLQTPDPQRVKQFSTLAITKNIPVKPAATGDVTITKIGHFGGATYAVEVSGNYAYTGKGSTFVVIDISDKTTPVEVGSLETNGIIRDIALVGNYAYVADFYNGLVIVDVSNPAAPTLIGSLDTSGTSRGVAVAGNYAYVADFYNGLVIVNVSNPRAPFLEGRYDTIGLSNGVMVVGNYAYVADGSNGFVIVDVSNPAAPILIGSNNTVGDSKGVVVAGNYAYVADWNNGLLIFNVSNPAAPTLKGSINIAYGYSEGVAVARDYAYVADSNNGLLIFNVSNPEAPTLNGRYNAAGTSSGVTLAGNYAYVADGENGLVIVDVNNPIGPTLKGSYHTAGDSRGVALAGNYAYVADNLNGLVIVDVSNPEMPTLKGNYDTAGPSYGVAVGGNYAYLADYYNGLVIVDVSNPAAPTLIGSYNISSWSSCYGVAVAGDYAYIACGYNGLMIFDVSNPAEPTLIGNYNTYDAYNAWSSSYGVEVAGDYAYVADGSNGLVIVDVSNPAVPTLIASYDTSEEAVGVAVLGNYAYVADSFNGLMIFDVNDPAAPTLIGNYYKWGGILQGVAVEGNYAYVADAFNGLMMIDVSNPAEPTLTGSYDTAVYSYGVDVSGNYAYVADGSNGLGIFRTGTSTSPMGSVHNINKGANYTTIQDAINDANQGDEIHVDSGTYYENVIVNKQLTLRGIGMPVVDAGGFGSAITLAADGIRLEGFTATGGGDSGIEITSNNNRLIGNTANLNNGHCGDYDYENDYCNYYVNGFGIYLESSGNNLLSGNNVSNNQYGIELWSSSNNTLSGNNVSSSNWTGIYLGSFSNSSNNNTLSSNNVSNNLYGIILWQSSKIVLMNNIMTGNNYNLELDGNSDSFFDNQIDTTNLVDGKSVYYIKNAKDIVYDSYTNAGTFYCISCVNVTLQNLDLEIKTYHGVFFWNTTRSKIQNVTASNTVQGIALDSSSNNTLISNNANSNNWNGISLSSSSNNTLIGNNALNNSYGISLSSSSNNTLSDNNVSSNNWIGIVLSSSSNNNIYHNNLIDNTNQAQDDMNTNSWDNGYPSGGNYWGDYIGSDTMSGSNQDQPGSDGIGDTAYPIASGSSEDKYPLMAPSTPGTPVESITGEGPVYFDTPAGIIQDLTAVNPDDMPETPPPEANLNYGLFRFNITGITSGGSVTLTLTFPEILPPGTTYWKYGANAANNTPHWYTIPSTINDNTITITLVDGGEGDDDMATNGMIKDDGGPSLPVNENNIAPVADCGTDKHRCENAGTKVQFNGTASYDPDGTIKSYYWEFGDGGIGTDVSPDHTYASYIWNGTAYDSYTVNLTVTDNSGLTNMTSQFITVRIAGDVNDDGKVDILDASVVGRKWGANDPCADLNNDGAVNILDASIIGLNWGEFAIMGG